MQALARPARDQRFATSLSGLSAFAKRVVDIACAAVLLVLVSPLMLGLALLIKFQDGEPVFYRRRVVGTRGLFDAFKLRTMRGDADDIIKNNPALRQEFEINFKLKEDPRVTPLGAMMRRTSLDELPQLWNVLKGEMSLVGPRMISPDERKKYGPNGWIFDCVKPGITGYWQVQGRQEVSYDRRVEMDLFYVKNWSLAMDLKILLKTPARVIRGVGAY